MAKKRQKGSRLGNVRLVLLLLLLLLSEGVHGRRWRLNRRDKESIVETEMCDLDPFITMHEPIFTPKETETEKWLKWSGFYQGFYSLPDKVQNFLRQLNDIILYEPPVGLVAIYVVVRLFWTGRIFRVFPQDNGPRSVEGVLRLEEKRRRRKRDRLSLDADDQSFDSYGGVERIRRRLCLSALSGLEDDSSPQIVAAVDALSVTYKPGSPRYTFVEEMAKPLSTLEHILIRDETQSNKGYLGSLRDMWATPQTSEDLILQMAAKTAEIRALDALLRLSRDHLLKTSSRLHRNRKHWQRRAKVNDNVLWIFDRLLKATIEGDRMRLAFAKAAFEAEVARLGSVQQVLIERPDDLSDRALLDSVSKSHNTTAPQGVAKNQEPPKKRRFMLPRMSKYSLRFNADGLGKITLRVYEGETSIRSDVALDKLLYDGKTDPHEWIEQAHDWTERAREVLCDVLRESLETSVSDDEQAEKDMETVEKWCVYDCRDCDALEDQWLAILDLADRLETLKRVGEGRVISVTDATGLRVWVDRLDVFGIPSSLVTIGLAQLAHNVLMPHWPDIQRVGKKTALIVWGIVKKRFWLPFYGIVQGLMNKGTTLMDAFDIANEEQSLDNMLFDLGFGDGTKETRKEALQMASRSYEDDLSSGVIKGILRGHLVRHLLVQVQQLKAGILHAMSSIDVLLDANRLNMQILAAIPAVLIAYIGTRIMYRSLFAFKAKAIRSIRDVHAEMAEYLDDMEIDLLLAAPNIAPTTIEQDVNGTPVSAKLTMVLPPKELGEFVLRVHSYLVLLNYCSPLLPHRATKAIHKAVQELVASHGLGTDRQVALLRLVKQKHMDLLKYLYG